MTTPGGELQANIFASVAQWERRVIGQRTKDALAAKRRAGTLNGPIGRPRLMPATSGIASASCTVAA